MDAIILSRARCYCRTVLLAVFVGAATLAWQSAGRADDPLAMAPPIDGQVTAPAANPDSAPDQSSSSNPLMDQQSLVDTTDRTTAVPPASPDSSSLDTVFNWHEVPENKPVTIVRGTFDKGGYQLYDDVGETILVPFNGDSLFVMKFAKSTADKTYLINDGDCPILYIASGWYLENATVAGARWYPFTDEFQPSEPEYIEPAPTYDSYEEMGWYPNMTYSGGYYMPVAGATVTAGVCAPEAGLSINIGSTACYSWHEYHNYCASTPGCAHVGWGNRDAYSSTPTSLRPFHGTGSTIWVGSSRPREIASWSSRSTYGQGGGSWGYGRAGAGGASGYGRAAGSDGYRSSHAFRGASAYGFSQRGGSFGRQNRAAWGGQRAQQRPAAAFGGRGVGMMGGRGMMGGGARGAFAGSFRSGMGGRGGGRAGRSGGGGHRR